MRLNKYIAHTGHATRREASRLILKGEIKVNGEVVRDDAYKVMEGDVITHKDAPLTKKIMRRYVLINKPKHFSTDPKTEKYIMGLLKRIDPSGLEAVDDKGPDSVGLVLLTDDPEVKEKLRDTDRKIKRIYLVTLDKEMPAADIKKLVRPRKTIEIVAASHVEGHAAHSIGLELHRGSEKLLRRTIERFGYTVERLDCNYYAGLTKKDLKRGWSRELTLMEERMIKHFV